MLAFIFIFLDDADTDAMERRVLDISLEQEEEEVLPPAGEDEEMLKMAIAMSLEQEEEEEPSSAKGELLRNAKQKCDKSFTGAAETEMVASRLPPSGDDKNNEDGMVTLIVTIEEKLLRRIETSGYPDFATEPTTQAEVEGEAAAENEPG